MRLWVWLCVRVCDCRCCRGRCLPRRSLYPRRSPRRRIAIYLSHTHVWLASALHSSILEAARACGHLIAAQSRIDFLGYALHPKTPHTSRPSYLEETS